LLSNIDGELYQERGELDREIGHVGEISLVSYSPFLKKREVEKRVRVNFGRGGSVLGREDIKEAPFIVSMLTKGGRSFRGVGLCSLLSRSLLVTSVLG